MYLIQRESEDRESQQSEARVNRTAQLKATITRFPLSRRPDSRVSRGFGKKTPAMKTSLRLTTLLVTASLCICSGRFAAAQSSTAPASPTDRPGQQTSEPASAFSSAISIPGPLRSFMRMAGISQKVSREEVLPLLARNVFTEGYEGQTHGRPTEFLILLTRYVQQARELKTLAGSDGVIRVSNCHDARELLRLLGYRAHPDCGQATTSLETADPERAFLTIDSGFPLPELEKTLQGGKPFDYPYPSSPVPVLFSENDWSLASRENNNRNTGDLVDVLLHDPLLARLYWALSRLDPETSTVLLRSVGLGELVFDAPVLDFYGSHICVRSKRVIVPGGTGAESAWKDLVGASPASPGDFISHLLAKDKGWLAAYFDTLSRVNQAQQAHFIQAQRLRRFYEAFRAPDPSAEAARAAFRPTPGLLLLLTRVQWEADGQPHIPGNLQVWREIVRQKSDSRIIRNWAKRARRWNDPEQLLETMFAFARVETDEGPLQKYLRISELDNQRSPQQRLTPETVRLLASKFAQLSDQYLIFSEFSELSNDSITRFVNVAESLNSIPNHPLRGNASGIFQATVGLWQILARQGQISIADLDTSWQAVVKPFARISSPAQLFDAGRNSLEELLRAATARPTAPQDEIIDLLAGPQQASSEGQQMHQEMANRIRSVLDAQRLVSLDTLLALGDGLEEMAHGKDVGDSLIPLAGELREFEMPRPIFTRTEKSEWAAGVYENRHTELQTRTNLTKVIKSPSSRAQLEQARGQLAAFLRDTLVGLNYAYYEPPGAQVLHNNPLLVRSHDFSGDTVGGLERVWQAPQLFGEGSPAGGGAYLVGSLTELPYVLAEVEQDFMAPENVQALIWKELVPGLVLSATLPRWWAVSRNELHAVTLYQRAGEELLAASVENQELRAKVMSILSDRMVPRTSQQVEQALRDKRVPEILLRMMPADTFYLAVEFRKKFPSDIAPQGPPGQELDSLTAQFPTEVSWGRLSRDFGVPHPILAQTYARELLNIKPFPAFQGSASRLFAESWDSNNLYWARLADEMGHSPVVLNRLVPEMTRRMVEKIFATDFEDWPAMLRAMYETGEEFRQGKITFASTTGATSRPSAN
jgi:hypothetical protein